MQYNPSEVARSFYRNSVGAEPPSTGYAPKTITGTSACFGPVLSSMLYCEGL